MTRSARKPLSEKVAEIQDVSVNLKQKEMIENLKDLGLIGTPKFNLAYGPTAQTYHAQ